MRQLSLFADPQPRPDRAVSQSELSHAQAMRRKAGVPLWRYSKQLLHDEEVIEHPALTNPRANTHASFDEVRL